jgi:hypothetical protein
MSDSPTKNLVSRRLKIEKEAVLQQLCAQREFERDIDRRQRDRSKARSAEFRPASVSAANYKILYVFDENIFEMFLDPANFDDYAAVSYTDSWDDDLYGYDETRRAINAQSALVTSEYLFGAHLPRQESLRPIYMTEWHFRELHSRLRLIQRDLEKLGKKITSDESDVAKLFANEIDQLVDLERLDRDDTSFLTGGTTLLEADLNDLRKRDVSQQELRQMYRARRAAEIFASTSKFHRLHQIKRIFSNDIARRLVPVHKDFRPARSAERDEIRKEASFWLDLLKAERDAKNEEQRTYGELEHGMLRAYLGELKAVRQQGLRHADIGDGVSLDVDSEAANVTKRLKPLARRLERLKSSPRGGRSDGSLRNDARAIAFLQWISRNKLNEDQRIVMITGDEILFEAYHSWYAAAPRSEPFLLRRVAQYAPIATLDEVLADDQEDASSSITYAMRKATIAQLFSFTLAEEKERPDASGPIEDRPSKTIGQAANHSAVKLSARKCLLQDNKDIVGMVGEITDERLNSRKQEIDALRLAWQHMERDAIGTNYKFIRRRFDKNLAAALANPDNDRKDTLVNYFKSAFDGLASNGIDLWFPLATDFIKAADWRAAFGSSAPPRVPTALRLRIPRPHGESQSEGADDVGQLVQRWVRDRDPDAERLLSVHTNQELSKRVDIIFAVAATLALRLEHWSDAERFADLARLSCRARTNEGEELPENDYFELLYLNALALRFHLGNTAVGDGISGSLNTRWLDLLQAAIELLSTCEQHHEKPGPCGEFAVLRVMRAVSERSAIRLFYVMWIASTLVDQPGRKVASRIIQRGQAELTAAFVDLRKCLTLQDYAEERAKGSTNRSDFLDLLKRQIYTNLASAQVIATVFKRSVGDVPGAILSEAEQEMVLLCLDRFFSEQKFEQLPLIAKVDIQAYRSWFSRTADDCARYGHELERLAEVRDPTNLAIDQIAVSVILRFQNLNQGVTGSSPVADTST